MERSYSGPSTFLVLPLTQPPKIYHPASFLPSLNLWILITQADLIVFRYSDLIQDPSLLDLVLKCATDSPLPASSQAARCSWLELCAWWLPCQPLHQGRACRHWMSLSAQSSGVFVPIRSESSYGNFKKEHFLLDNHILAIARGTTRAKVDWDKWEGGPVFYHQRLRDLVLFPVSPATWL